MTAISFLRGLCAVEIYGLILEESPRAPYAGGRKGAASRGARRFFCVVMLSPGCCRLGVARGAWTGSMFGGDRTTG